MKKTKTPKKFEWIVSSYQDVDLDLLELQLYSLCKLRNLNFSEDLFKDDLKKSDGYLDRTESKAVDLAIKSFCMAFKKVLSGHGVDIRNFKVHTVEDYGEYELEVTDSIISESKADIRAGLYNSDDSVGDRISSIAAAPLSFFSLLRKDAYVTYGAATKNMMKNLILWEKNIIECAVAQLRREKIMKGLFE